MVVGCKVITKSVSTGILDMPFNPGDATAGARASLTLRAGKNTSPLGGKK